MEKFFKEDGAFTHLVKSIEENFKNVHLEQKTTKKNTEASFLNLEMEIE